MNPVFSALPDDQAAMMSSRRTFLTRSAAAGFSALTAAGGSAAHAMSANDDRPIIDTHQHLWDLDRFVLPWISPTRPDHAPLRHNYLIPEYRRHSRGLGIVNTVYMEVNVRADQQRAEADFATELCGRRDSGVAGAVIGGSPHLREFAHDIQPLAERNAVKGVRMVLHDPDRPAGLCLQPTFVDNMRRLGDLDLSFDLCMRPDELRDGARLAARCPNTRFILDHCGNWPVRSGDPDRQQRWKDGIRAAADRPNMYIKISGIIASVDKDHWTPDDLAPGVDFCLDAFGPDRCLFGGDWPVCLLGASLKDWVHALKRIVRTRSQEFQQKLFHDNAVAVYRLNVG